VLKNDNIVLKNDNIVLKNDNIVLKNDNIVLKKDNIVLKDDVALLQSDSRFYAGDLAIVLAAQILLRHLGRQDRVIATDLKICSKKLIDTEGAAFKQMIESTFGKVGSQEQQDFAAQLDDMLSARNMKAHPSAQYTESRALKLIDVLTRPGSLSAEESTALLILQHRQEIGNAPRCR
jgi:hypothetical protein